MICYSKRGEPRLSFGYKFVGLPWKRFKLYPTVHSYLFFSSHSIVLFPLRTPTTWRSATCTRRLFKVWMNWPYSKCICYSQRGETRLSVGYKFIGLPWKLLKLYPSLQSHFFFFLHTVLYCFHWKHKQLEGLLKCTRMLFKLWRNLPNSKCICYSERGEPRLSFGYTFVGLPWKLLKLYPTVHSYLFFSSHSIVLFPLRTPTPHLKKCYVQTEAL